MACAAIFRCNGCGKERASGEFSGHKSGMRDSSLYCENCEEKIPHVFVKHIWDDTSPEEWESLLASEPPARSRGNSNQGKEQTMLNIQKRQVPTGSEAAPRGVTFLSPRHVTKEGVIAKIVKATSDKPDNFGNPVVVLYSFGGQKYSKGYKLTSDNLAAQAEILGLDESKWAGKTILIAKTVGDENDERLCFLPAPKGK